MNNLINEDKEKFEKSLDKSQLYAYDVLSGGIEEATEVKEEVTPEEVELPEELKKSLEEMEKFNESLKDVTDEEGNFDLNKMIGKAYDDFIQENEDVTIEKEDVIKFFNGEIDYDNIVAKEASNTLAKHMTAYPVLMNLFEDFQTVEKNVKNLPLEDEVYNQLTTAINGQQFEIETLNELCTGLNITDNGHMKGIKFDLLKADKPLIELIKTEAGAYVYKVHKLLIPDAKLIDEYLKGEMFKDVKKEILEEVPALLYVLSEQDRIEFISKYIKHANYTAYNTLDVVEVFNRSYQFYKNDKKAIGKSDLQYRVDRLSKKLRKFNKEFPTDVIGILDNYIQILDFSSTGKDEKSISIKVGCALYKSFEEIINEENMAYIFSICYTIYETLVKQSENEGKPFEHHVILLDNIIDAVVLKEIL